MLLGRLLVQGYTLSSSNALRTHSVLIKLEGTTSKGKGVEKRKSKVKFSASQLIFSTQDNVKVRELTFTNCARHYVFFSQGETVLTGRLPNHICW